MSGHEKSRAVVLAALMVLSVLATGLAFTGGAAAAPTPTDRTGTDLNVQVSPDHVTTGGPSGSNPDTVIVNVKNGDDANETYSYTVTDPDSNTVTTGSSADDTFSFTIDPTQEGDYSVSVTATSDNTTLNGDTGSATVTSRYDLSVQPSEVAAGDNTQVVTGQLVNDQGKGVSSQTIALRDTDDTNNDDSDQATLDASVSDANGQVSFQFTPDQVGRYPVTNEDGSITYDNVTVTANELTVMANRSQLLVSKTDSVDFTVSSDGQQLNGSELSNLIASIMQNSSDVGSNGNYVDTNGDEKVDTYRVDVQASQSANAPVNATFSNNTFSGTTTLEPVLPDVQVSKASPFTKGVRTDVTLTATDPRNGNEIGENSEFGIDVDGGTFEAQSSEVQLLDTNGSTDSTGVELQDDEFAIISEQNGADDNNVLDINATVFAFNDSAGTSVGTGGSTQASRAAFNQSIITHVVAVADDDSAPQQPAQVAAATQPAETDSVFDYNGLVTTDYTFEPLQAEANPDSIPLSGSSQVTVTTNDAQGNALARGVDLHNNQNSVYGNTGSDGQITFSVNPTSNDPITQNTFYDDDLVSGDSQAPFEVQTDTIQVTTGNNGQGQLSGPNSKSFNNVNVGNSNTKTVTLTNTGNGPVTVTETAIRGPDGKQFDVVNNPAGSAGDNKQFTLQQGESRDLTVRFSPNSAGAKSATLYSDTANDGSVQTQLSGTGVAKPGPNADHTLTISGNGDKSHYRLSVTDDLQKSTANGANVNRNDEIRRGYVGAGVVGSGADSYTYNGTLETLKVSDGATVSVDGRQLTNEEVDNMPVNAIEIAGTGPRATYTFSTLGSRSLQKLTANNANLNANDHIYRTTANGVVGTARDAYGFDGGLASLKVSGDANVYVNGLQRHPAAYNSHVITIVGNGNKATYSFDASGHLAKSTANFANLNRNDAVSGHSANGVVGTAADSYTYTGRLSNVEFNGDVTVYIDGRMVDQGQVGS